MVHRIEIFSNAPNISRMTPRIIMESIPSSAIADVSKDPPTPANPLVAGESGFRFYLGIPLKTEPNTQPSRIHARQSRKGLVLIDVGIADPWVRVRGFRYGTTERATSGPIRCSRGLAAKYQDRRVADHGMGQHFGA